MANPWDNDPVVDPFEDALKAEGLTGKAAAIARSIYQQESSSGKNTKTSNAGAVGGMQIIPATFKSVADKDWDINDPTQNARAGIRYVKKLFEQAGGDPALTAAGYYGGPGGLEKARRGVAVSDPRNPNAPTTLQYGQQVAARIPKEKGLVQRGVEAVIPSATAAEPAQGNPWDNDPIIEDATPKPAAKPEGKSMMATATDAVTRALPGGTIINAIRGPGVDRDALKGFASGMADVGNTIINAGTKAAADFPDELRLNPQAQSEAQNVDRQAGLQSYNTENASPGFTGGRIAGNIAATAPVGSVAGAGVAAAGLPRLGSAIASGGMTTGAKVAPGLAAGAADMGIRMAGGAAAGGMTAGLVDPASASAGATIGAALPPVVKGLGAAGSAVGRTLRGPEVPPNVLAAAAQGREAGYVIPPTQARPTLTNRLLEGFSGKITTAQNASARNQGVTNELAKKAINAPELTPEGLSAVRAQANQAYDVLGKSAPFQADDAFRSTLEKVGASSKQLKADFPELVNKDVDSLVEGLAGRAEFDAQSTIEAIKRLRASSSANKISMDPEKKALGQVQSKVSAALEDLVERNLQGQGNTQALDAYRAARQTLAKTYDIEKALNPASGNVDANKLAQLLKKGRPLTGELKTIAEFSSTFPKATQTVEKMGSLPQTSPLDWAAMGIGSAATGNPLMMAGVLARPAARAATLSPMVQNKLAQQPNRLMQISQEDLNLLAPLYRGAPLTGTSQSGR